jgi:hypothetical protein
VVTLVTGHLLVKTSNQSETRFALRVRPVTRHDISVNP